MKAAEIIDFCLEKLYDKRKAVILLEKAKYSLGNFIGSCKKDGCTEESPCFVCKDAQRIWDRITKYLEEE